MMRRSHPKLLVVLGILLALVLPQCGRAQFNFITNADNTITITGYTGAGGDVIIPDSTNGFPVTAIGIQAFYFCSSLTNITIPNNVTSIGTWAFGGCSDLKTIFIPDSVTTIGVWAFWGCGLTTVRIPSSVTNIGVGAFQWWTSLTNSSLTNIDVDATNPNYASVDGVLFDKAVSTLMQCPAGKTGSYSVPDSVSTIGTAAFGDCSGLTSVNIGCGVNGIGEGAFGSCSSLTSVTIPNNVTSIGNWAFSGCSSLTNINVDTANPNYTSVDGVLFDKDVSTLLQCPEGFFGNYSIPNSVINIGGRAFEECFNLTSVTIPNGVTNISFEAFFSCSGLTSVTIPNGVNSIGYYAFAWCSSLHQVCFEGNAPTVNGGAGSADDTIFQGNLGTACFLPGTTGWDDTFGGWPTAQWFQPQPQILGSAHGLGVGSNGFQFTVSWATNTSVILEASTNLLNWSPVSTNALVNGTNAFADSAWTVYPQRFYRVRSP